MQSPAPILAFLCTCWENEGCMNKQESARQILVRLKRRYRRTGPFVSFRNPLELVVATMLSAQCTDVQVNKVTKKLFKKYRTARDYAMAPLKTLEKEIYSTGFYHSKARYLKGIGRMLMRRFEGRVPANFNDLVALPGISTKSANLIMAKAFNKPTGIAVDTHVLRVAPRLGLTKEKNPHRMGKDLERLFEPRDYLSVNEYFITHGRATCKPKPRCPSCVLKDICPSAKMFIRRYYSGGKAGPS